MTVIGFTEIETTEEAIDAMIRVKDDLQRLAGILTAAAAVTENNAVRSWMRTITRDLDEIADNEIGGIVSVIQADDEEIPQEARNRRAIIGIDFSAVSGLRAGIDYPADLWEQVKDMTVLLGIKHIASVTKMKLNTCKDLYHFLAEQNKISEGKDSNGQHS